MSGSSSNGVVAFEVVNRIAWARFNGPDKRNAMCPTLNRDMMEVLDSLEFRPDVRACPVARMTAWTGGIHLKDYP